MNIKELREQYGLSRKQLSERYGIPYRTIQDWELGNRKCPDYVVNLLQLDLERNEPLCVGEINTERLEKNLAEIENYQKSHGLRFDK